MKNIQIGIVGSAGVEEYQYKKPSKKIFQNAYKLGKLVAKNNCLLVCGGKGGIMKESSRGAKELGGITIGIISGNKRGQSNKFIDVEIVSGMTNCAEESLLVSSSDGIIVLGGGAGTLQEITLAYRNKKPIAVIKPLAGWGKELADSYLDDRNTIKIFGAKSPDQALKYILNKIKSTPKT